jgi:hypothetical protein
MHIWAATPRRAICSPADARDEFIKLFIDRRGTGANAR